MSTWSEQHEAILKEWKAKCFVNLWLQDASAYYYTRMYNWLSYPIIIISSVSSAALFSSNNAFIKYIVGIMTLSSGVLTAITRQLKPGELHQQHASATRRYHNLIRSIDTCLSLTPPMRAAPDIFIEKTGTEIDNLATSMLDPPLKIIKTFEGKYGTLDRMLYGEDIVELMKIEMKANKMFKRVRKSANGERFSDESNYPQAKKQADEQVRYNMFAQQVSNLEKLYSKNRSDLVTIDINQLQTTQTLSPFYSLAPYSQQAAATSDSSNSKEQKATTNLPTSQSLPLDQPLLLSSPMDKDKKPPIK